MINYKEDTAGYTPSFIAPNASTDRPGEDGKFNRINFLQLTLQERSLPNQE